MVTSIVSITTWISYFNRALNALISLQHLCGILGQTCLSRHGYLFIYLFISVCMYLFISIYLTLGNISNLWGSNYRKMYFASQKPESRHFQSCLNYSKALTITGKTLPSPRFLSSFSSHAEGNYLFPFPMQCFFENLFPLSTENGKWRKVKVSLLPHLGFVATNLKNYQTHS